MIKHIVASGCSFTAAGIGGVPPSPEDPDGGCSVVQDEAYQILEPKSWVEFVARNMQVKSLINVAAESHGNILIANNIMSVLQKFKYPIGNTLVLFNISDPARLDMVCDWQESGKSDFCKWPSSILDFAYISQTDKQLDHVRKNMGIENIEKFSSNVLLGLFCFLQSSGFDFRFMTMRDYRSNQYISTIIDRFSKKWIDLDPGHGMMEFVEQLGLTISNHDFHPNLQGHNKLANCVLETL